LCSDLAFGSVYRLKGMFIFIFIVYLRRTNKPFTALDRTGARRSRNWDSNPAGEELTQLSRQALRSIQPPIQWVPGLFARGLSGRSGNIFT